MFCDQKSKVGVLGLFLRVLVAVAVYSNDAIGIFIYNNALRVHTESTYIILKLLCTVYDLAFVQFVC